MKSKVVIVCSVVLLIALGAFFFFTRDKATIPEGSFDTFTLRVGETYVPERGSSSYTLVAITEDSRCPLGVECIWAGLVGVQLSLEQEGNQSTATFAGNPPILEQGDTLLVATEVRPYPREGKSIAEEDYRVTFSFYEKDTYNAAHKELLAASEVSVEGTFGACSKEPLFEDYPVVQSDRYVGQVMRPQLPLSNDQAYNDALDISLESVTFAGAYSWFEWNCTEGVCAERMLFDAQTGEVIKLSLESKEGILYVPDSYLIVVDPPEYTKDASAEALAHYVLFDPEGPTLTAICTGWYPKPEEIELD